MADQPRVARGVLDTSVVIDFEAVDSNELPVESAVSAVTMAELAAGPYATDDPDERGRRQDRLQRAEANLDPLPFGIEEARAYGRIYSAEVAAGRKPPGPGAVDLLIAATALATQLPLYTRHGDDFRALDGLLAVIVV